MIYSLLQLNPREERRLKAGHLWIYSNEINVAKTPLKSFTPGQLVTIVSSTSKPLGIGYVNPHSLLCVRLLSTDCKTVVTLDWVKDRLKTALKWRERCFSKPYYRWIFGESDGMPGLVMDRFDDTVVLQFNTSLI